MSSSNSCFLTCLQIFQEADQVVWYSHIFKNFPQFVVIHIVKGFDIVNKAEIDVFLELFLLSWWSNRCWQFDHLLLGRKVMTNLDSILKSRYITLPTKIHLVKAVFFPVVMYGCESWTIKMAECWRIDAFELWCWRRLLRVPWTARRSNQSILKEISPECLLEGLMMKLKLQYFGHLMRRADSLEKTLMLWKTEGRSRWEWVDEMVGWHHWLNGHEFE